MILRLMGLLESVFSVAMKYIAILLHFFFFFSGVKTKRQSGQSGC